MGVPIWNPTSTITPGMSDMAEALLAAFIETLASLDVPIRGRKALQKLLYFAQFQGWPPTSYRLHLFGPYSDEVAAALDVLEARGAIRVDLERLIRPSGLLQRATAAAELTSDQRAAVERIAAQFGHDDPRTLELLATLLYIWKREMSLYRRTSDYQLVRQVQRYKGAKFASDEIDLALGRLRNEGYLTA